MLRYLTSIVLAASIALPAIAATPRELLLHAAFQTRDKASALVQVEEVAAAAKSALARDPADREAKIIRAMAIGYRAKLERSRSDALAARKMFDALAATDPRDAEAQAAVGAWHIDAVTELGGFVAGTVLGARKATGLAAMDRALALGGNRAMYPGLAALLRLSLDPKDASARGLAEAAVRAATPFETDRTMQRSARAILVTLRGGDRRAIQAMARQLLPFGRIKK